MLSKLIVVAVLCSAADRVASAQETRVAPPASFATITPLRVQVGDSVRIPLVVNDVPPGTPVEFRLERQPASARVDNGVLRWRPLRGDGGSSLSIGIRAVVGAAEIAHTAVAIVVEAAHRPPVVRQPADRVVPPGDSLSFVIDASDPDGDQLSYAIANLTDPALTPRIDPHTGAIGWGAPHGPANRVYLWRVTVSDGDGGIASIDFRVAVRAQNVAPVCGPMRTYKRDEGETVEIALDADDANGDSLVYQPLMTLPNGTLRGSTYQWNIPYAFVSLARQDSTVRFEWRATDPSATSSATNCLALITVIRSIPEAPFRARQQQHRQLVADVRSELVALASREGATRDSLAATAARKRTVKRASLVSALLGGLLQIARSEDTRRVAAGISATLTVGFAGWESTLDDGAPLSARAETIAQQRTTLQRALARFLRKYGETVTRDALLGSAYEADHLELYDLLAAAGRVSSVVGAGPALPVSSAGSAATRSPALR